MLETQVLSPGWEDPLKNMATHSSILAWRIPWTEEPGRLQSMGFQRVGHNRVTNTFTSLHFIYLSVQFSRSSHVRLFVTPWTAACQASLSLTNSWSLLKLMSIELVMPSNHLILCRPLLLLPSDFPSIRSFPVSQFFASGGPTFRFRLDWNLNYQLSCFSGLIVRAEQHYQLLGLQPADCRGWDFSVSIITWVYYNK